MTETALYDALADFNNADAFFERVTTTRYLVQYTGKYRTRAGDTTEIPLVSIIDLDGTRMTRIREYWDTHRLAILNAEPSQR